MSSLRAIAAYVPVKHLYRVDYFTSSSGQVYLTVNKQTYVGRYSSLEDAIEVVKGILTRLGCHNPDECIKNLPSNITEIPSGADPITVAMRSWDASVILPVVENPSASSFDFSQNSIVISRLGFDSQGNSVVRQITTKFIRPVRIPYDPANPLTSQNSLNSGTVPPDIEIVEDKVHARLMTQEYIYETDTISMSYNAGFYDGVETGGVPTLTNTSTLQCPPPVCNFSTYGDTAVFASDENITADVIAYHISVNSNALQGIAAVKFEVFKNDETVPILTQIKTSVELDAHKVPVYRFSSSLSSLNLVSDDEIYVRATVCPYWGPSKSSVRVSYGSSDWNTRYNDFQDIRFVYEPSYCPKIYVSTTGNDANSGDINNPVATIAGALSKFSSGANTPCQGFVYCEPGEYTHFSLSSNSNTGKNNCRFMLSIEKKPNTTGNVVFRGGQLQSASGDSIFHRNFLIRFKDLDFQFTTTLYSGTGNGTTPGTRIVTSNGSNILAYVIENCSVECDPNNNVVATGNFIWPTGSSRRRFIINNRTKNRLINGWFGLEGSTTTSIFKGNYGQGKMSGDVSCGNQMWSTAIVVYSSTLLNEIATISPIRTLGNQICAYNEIVTTNPNQETVQLRSGNNYALVCNMIYAAEYDGTTNTNAVTTIWPDNSEDPIDNALIWHNTVSGGRSNSFYNDRYPGISTPGDPSDDITNIPRTNVSIKNNLFRRFYIKSDPFSQNPLVQGNWPVMNSVSCRNNVSFNYAGVNSFRREYEGNDFSQTSNSNNLVLDDPYSGETGIVGGAKFSAWPHLAPNAYDFMAQNNTTISDVCLYFPKDGIPLGYNWVGCGPNRYPPVYVPDLSGQDNREFTSYGTGFIFAIQTVTANQGYTLSVGNTQLVSFAANVMIVTQSGNTVNDSTLSNLILGAQLIIEGSPAIGSTSSSSTFALRFRVGNDFIIVDNFLQAFPGGYIKAYYRGVNDQNNQYRELRTLEADTSGSVPSSVYVRASTSSLFELDALIDDQTAGQGAQIPGLEPDQPIRFEFYASEGLTAYVSPSISFNSITSTESAPPVNNVSQLLNAVNPLVAQITWAGDIQNVNVRVSETSFLTNDFASNPSEWTLIKNGSIINIPNNYYVGFSNSTTTASNANVTLTDIYNPNTTYTFNSVVEELDVP